MKPRHESQNTQSPDIEATEQVSLFGSVNSVSMLCALCDKKIFTKNVINTGQLHPPTPARDVICREPVIGSPRTPPPLPPMELVIFDLETTGFSPRSHEIIQIAAVRMRHGEVIAGESFATFVRPQSEIPSFISDLTGITSADMRDALDPALALQAFSRFVGDATLVAHNARRIFARC